MNAQNKRRCPHYQIYSEQLHFEGPPAFLAIRRCMLTERLLQFLDSSEEGRLLGEKMVIHSQSGKRYAFVGPDMEPVTQHACDGCRCEDRCTPAYVRTLDNFGITDPDEESVTCTEDDEHVSTLPKAQVPTPLPL